jgi:hypothetical protein
MADRKRCCCNCGNCERVSRATGIENYCAIDFHRIDYIETFEGWCRRWKKIHTVDGERKDNERKAD